MKCSSCQRFHPANVSCEAVSSVLSSGAAYRVDFLADEVEEVEDGWIVEGLAIPYGVELERFDYLTGATRWTFDEGSVEVEDDALLFYGHDHLSGQMPIGLVLESNDIPAAGDKPAGKRIKARVSKTVKGTEVRTLLKDKVLRRFSVGLDRPNAVTQLEDVESDAPLLRWTKAPVWETSVVPRAAYHEHALIDSVLSMSSNNNRKGDTMKCNQCGAPQHAGACAPDVLAAYQLANGQQGSSTAGELATEVATLSAGLERVERQLATVGDSLAAGSSAPPIEVPGATYGEFLQLAARGDQSALDFLAFVGTDTGDLIAADWIQETWVGPLVNRMIERRTVLNLFTTRPLPATGMSVPYGRTLNDGTLTVERQVNEGDLLPYGKLAFDAGASTPVETFGGWSDMSRQVIDRSGQNIVEALFLGLFNRYLQVTELRARAVAMNPVNARPSAAAQNVHVLTNADGWIDFILDSSFALGDAGLPLDFILVGRNRFRQLAHMREGANGDAEFMLERNFGRISLTGQTGETLELPIIPVNNPADQNAVRAGSGDGIVTYEAPGAPFRLQDDDITNLTSAFSIYGYAAFAVENENALIRPSVAGDPDADGGVLA